MNEKQREFVGYHGTSHLNAKNIEKQGFIQSPNGWLGNGIYFFQQNRELARLWAFKNNRDRKIQVLERNIKVKDEKLFDMADTLGEHNSLFHKLRLDLVGKSSKLGVKCNFDKDKIEEQIRKIETQIINTICEKGKYEVVRAATFTKSQYGIDIWSVCPNGIEICVKNDNCIYK
ncbi:hypothetical protein [Clostridium botulinum]|uniref:hypothetical protein n=1 Tax=Clostridium botulinum TaxID=1491 RepID=UPI0007736656|nr:hypothetical protein [Clostridium botulinum]